MFYVTSNPKTKRKLKELVAAGKAIRVFAPGLGNPPENGTCAVGGPQYPAAHTWYGTVTVKNGIVVSVK